MFPKRVGVIALVIIEVNELVVFNVIELTQFFNILVVPRLIVVIQILFKKRSDIFQSIFASCYISFEFARIYRNFCDERIILIKVKSLCSREPLSSSRSFRRYAVFPTYFSSKKCILKKLGENHIPLYLAGKIKEIF